MVKNRGNRGMQELKLLFVNLAGDHLKKDSKDSTQPSSVLQNRFGINCCDVVTGDCTTGQCV